jgi:S-layer homology domain
MKPRSAWLAGSFLALGLASLGLAQPVVSSVIDEFGTKDGNDLWIPASQFTGENGASWIEGLSEGLFGYFYSAAAGPASFHAHLPLPQGAYVDSWRAFYYDNSSANNFTIGFVKWYDDTTAAPVAGSTSIDNFVSSGTPGLTSHHQADGFTVDLREPLPGSLLTRNQAADFYTFYVVMPADFNVQFKGVRVIWHRQVSPAPATATFNDVPTSDPAFQYIEALVAAGITSGCNTAPPQFCPDATLTRRQMAVFLSKALGLHWPNF